MYGWLMAYPSCAQAALSVQVCEQFSRSSELLQQSRAPSLLVSLIRVYKLLQSGQEKINVSCTFSTCGYEPACNLPDLADITRHEIQQQVSSHHKSRVCSPLQTGVNVKESTQVLT
jgi:hypothetical protein